VSSASRRYRGLYPWITSSPASRPSSAKACVVINQTLTVDQQLQVATLQETVTVTGASPIVDTSTTQLGTNFTKELLTEIPNARDIWAAMAQAPGIQMTNYDVGGSNTGNQSGFRSYGFDTQNQTRMEGIDTTEGTAANAGYFDFGSFEEFQVGGAGADASAFAGGAVLSISVKSGGDRFSGNFYYDYLNEDTIAETNVPDYLQTANTPNEDGFFTRTPLSRGNPVQEQYDLNFNVGGPIWKQKAWFFYSYRLNDQYTYILGLDDQVQRSKLTNPYTLKGTFQIGRNNQIIGFFNKREKLQNKRDVSLTTPLSAAYYQSSRNYPMKAQWTSVLSSRMFLDVMAAQWYNFFPLRPSELGVDVGPGPAGQQGPYYEGRQPATGPEAVQAAVPPPCRFQGWLEGQHDFKVGYDWKRSRLPRSTLHIFYRDSRRQPRGPLQHGSAGERRHLRAPDQRHWKFNTGKGSTGAGSGLQGRLAGTGVRPSGCRRQLARGSPAERAH
jgi:hypothetical protein